MCGIEHFVYDIVTDLFEKIRASQGSLNIEDCFEESLTGGDCILRRKVEAELIVNLSAKFNDSSAIEFQKVVHVHGVCFTISSSLLNQFMELSVYEDLAVTYQSFE